MKTELSAGEWTLMKALWRGAPMTITQLTEVLSPVISRKIYYAVIIEASSAAKKRMPKRFRRSKIRLRIFCRNIFHQ